MTLSIQHIPRDQFTQAVNGFVTAIQDKAAEVFSNVKELFPLHRHPRTKEAPLVNWQAVVSGPETVIEGGIWGGFLGLSAYFFAKSLGELYTVFTVEPASLEKHEKIKVAAKKVFIDFASLLGSSAYTAIWADGAKIISLGKYLPAVKNLCFGTSLVINGLEVGAGLAGIWTEKEAILRETSPTAKEMHKEFLCHTLIKLIADVSMVAWAALGIGTIAGLAISSVLMSVALGVGFVFGMTALIYRNHLDQKYAPPPVSSMVV